MKITPTILRNKIEEMHTLGAFLLLVPRFSATESQEAGFAGWPYASSSIKVPTSLEIA
jgi:hypothetical protein